MKVISLDDKEYKVLLDCLDMLEVTGGYENAIEMGHGSPATERIMATFKSLVEKIKE